VGRAVKRGPAIIAGFGAAMMEMRESKESRWRENKQSRRAEGRKPRYTTSELSS
jgi:hypothetical protein